jgi:D-alanyl-D-alanine carboxypeptidase/D-alanyl-D-alanine-endopeptidase (penicillin-binding protein 4)
MLKGEGGTEEAGIEVVKNYWKSLGVNLDGLNMTDGCGLSRSNGITTLIQATVLQKISKQKWYPDFLKSLPVAGKSGSMTSLCKGTLAEDNLQAKTGYINRARGYAGYVKTKSGKLLCFSLLANNYTCTPTEMKKKLERILVAMAEIQ